MNIQKEQGLFAFVALLGLWIWSGMGAGAKGSTRVKIQSMERLKRLRSWRLDVALSLGCGGSRILNSPGRRSCVQNLGSGCAGFET